MARLFHTCYVMSASTVIHHVGWVYAYIFNWIRRCEYGGSLFLFNHMQPFGFSFCQLKIYFFDLVCCRNPDNLLCFGTIITKNAVSGPIAFVSNLRPYGRRGIVNAWVCPSIRSSVWSACPCDKSRNIFQTFCIWLEYSLTMDSAGFQTLRIVMGYPPVTTKPWHHEFSCATKIKYVNRLLEFGMVSRQSYIFSSIFYGTLPSATYLLW